MANKDVIRKIEAPIAPQSLHVGPVFARSRLLEETGDLIDGAAHGRFLAEFETVRLGTVDVNELPAEGTHFFGVCVPHLRTPRAYP